LEILKNTCYTEVTTKCKSKAEFQVPETLNPELKSNARKLIFEKAPKLFIVSAIFVVIVTAITELQFRLPGTISAYSQYMELIALGTPHAAGVFLSFIKPAGAALAAVLMILGGVVRVGLMSYCLKTSRGRPADLIDIFKGFQYLLKVSIILIVTALLVAGWSILFLFPGIAAFYRYRQAFYILLDDPRKSPLQCVRESKLMMHGRKLDLFLLDLSFVGWFAISVTLSLVMLLSFPFTIPIVSVWLSPYAGLSRAAFYDRLLDNLAV